MKSVMLMCLSAPFSWKFLTQWPFKIKCIILLLRAFKRKSWNVSSLFHVWWAAGWDWIFQEFLTVSCLSFCLWRFKGHRSWWVMVIWLSWQHMDNWSEILGQSEISGKFISPTTSIARLLTFRGVATLTAGNNQTHERLFVRGVGLTATSCHDIYIWADLWSVSV